MQPKPWPQIPVNRDQFHKPPREYGILPFWFLNGELDLEEMRYQLREFREKGMPGIILHGRYGLETPYIGEIYLDRIHFAVEEAEKLGLQTWIYDEMNWPSGTADKRVLQARPDLAQRYIECINMTVRGPWFTYLTGADSRYLDFEKSTPVAAFAVRMDGPGEVIDLTPNLSFHDVIPWEAPAGNWRLMYIVEKIADYYIDAMNPESTAEFLKLGYEPYASVVDGKMSSQMLGFYTDEPAMHYYLSGAENPVVPWTKNMFRRFQERNGYNLRPRLPDLFFDIRPDSARVRYDFYNTLTDFYSEAFYKQIHEWCQEHNVLFTGHLLYEEWLRRLVRVEGNIFKHYPHMDVIGVDHLYPIIGNRDRPDEHVAMKVGSSAAHQLGSPRLLCESFGGIFMDATMQRMKWIADWEYVLGVNLLNPHGFHYTLEGPRKRDWPPSMFYQYPWWGYYGEFSNYMSRLSHLLSGGKHIAKVAMLWPMNAMFATYTPQSHNAIGDRIERDFNVLTDLLLRLHYDFDYLDEDMLATAELEGSTIRIRDEAYELLVLPPMAHLKLSTLEQLEKFVAQGGRVLGMIFLPNQAFANTDGATELVDISDRLRTLFGIDPGETQQNFEKQIDIQVLEQELPEGGKTAFLQTYALSRQLPMRIQQELDTPGKTESPFFVIESEERTSRYFFAPQQGERQEITDEVNAERNAVADGLEQALSKLIEPDVVIDNREVFYLHRQNDGQDIYFIINPTYAVQKAQISLSGETQPVHWDPSTGVEKLIAPSQVVEGRTRFELELPPVGSAFILVKPVSGWGVIDTNLNIESIDANQLSGFGRANEAFAVIAKDDNQKRLTAQSEEPAASLTLDGEWEFQPEGDNALVIGKWLATHETTGRDRSAYAKPDADTEGWLPMVPGAWSYQLPAEPTEAYPIPVWSRISFEADYLPPKVNLIVDGFAGSEWSLYVNGEQVKSTPVRSQVDGQMKAVDITQHLRKGQNLIALRLVVTNPTDGLLDLLKLTGDFSLAPQGDGTYRIAAPCQSLEPRSWTDQGYPHFSGRAVYRKRFQLPESFADQRVFVEPQMDDDVLEVLVNGQSAGVRLWEPYQLEVTNLLKPGENTLELRVANTLVNLLERVERRSGLAGAPKLVPYRMFTFDLTNL
ncbi:MAG TPA: glycosyl hydrolase [Anaerolineales bacterium]|nr:glycosyl hydrolase [Anaerolineales bacterium]